MKKKIKDLTLGDALTFYNQCSGCNCESCPMFSEKNGYCAFEDITTVKLQDIIKLKYESEAKVYD